MKKTFFLLIGTLGFLTSEAQINQNVAIGSDRNIIRSKRTDADFEGSPYLFSDWQKAVVQFGAGIEPSSSEVKYDLLADLLVLKGKDGEEYEFKDQPKEFLLTSSKELYKNGFAPVDQFTGKTFYQVLYDGKVKFLKKATKTVIESKGYNSATITRKIADDTQYYIVKADNKPIKVKYNEKSIIGVLGKNDELVKYIKENKLNVKSIDGLVKLLNYYDTL
ncbi:hypothetical protein [Pedobacter zeae]|uniref:Uncharacterized protein n=1 Tax=Pedobacter zeae TaxID=1737356 RepID=A0A7W6P767_9SPHI|nr:hypothetical protein [Pedobacter zeae]MBB4109613.1 hypothetical protein [Pedobacter zeae]GGH13239.1 hypothetical protein GCM10007422_33720 [Pedobacter zeae]